MKKLLALLLILTLAFMLIACDNTPDNGNGGDNTQDNGNNNTGNNGGSGNQDTNNGGETNKEPVTEGPIIPWPMD